MLNKSPMFEYNINIVNVCRYLPFRTEGNEVGYDNDCLSRKGYTKGIQLSYTPDVAGLKKLANTGNVSQFYTPALIAGGELIWYTKWCQMLR